MAHPPKKIPEAWVDIIKAKLWARRISKVNVIDVDTRKYGANNERG